MTRKSRLTESVLMRQAERLLRDENLLRLPIDIETLAKSRQIVLKPMNESEDGVSGMLARYGNTFGILYSTNVRNSGFRRFSIAHELGHYFIDGHVDQIPFDQGVHRSRANFVSNDPYERQADYFAAGLLMPGTPLRDVMRGVPDGLPVVEAIRRSAQVSLTASAIRYVGLSNIASAVVVSKKGGE